MSHELNSTIRAIAQCEQAARELGKSLDKFAESGEKFRESADRAARLEKRISDSNAFGRLLESTGEIRRMSEYFAKNLPEFTAAMEAAREAAAGSQKDLKEGVDAAKSVIPGLQAMGQVGKDVEAIRKALEHLKDADLAGEAAQLVQVQKDLEDQVFAQKGILQQAKELVVNQTSSMEQAAKELQESLDLCGKQAVQTENLIAANLEQLRTELSALWKAGQDDWGRLLDARQKEGMEAQMQLLQSSTARLEEQQGQGLSRMDTLLADSLHTMEEDLRAHMELQEEHLNALQQQSKHIETERQDLTRIVQEGADYLSRTAEASAAAVADTAELMAKRLEHVLQSSLDRLIRSQEEQMADIRRRLDRLERMVQDVGKADEFEEHLLEVAADLDESGKAGRAELLEALQAIAAALPKQVAAAAGAQLASGAGKPDGSAKADPSGNGKASGQPGGAPAKSAAQDSAAKPKEPAAPQAPKAYTYTQLLELTPPFTVRKDNWKGDFCYRVEKISGSHIRGKYYKDGKLYPKLDAPDVLGTFYVL